MPYSIFLYKNLELCYNILSMATGRKNLLCYILCGMAARIGTHNTDCRAVRTSP
jgi:hypothetical protein